MKLPFQEGEIVFVVEGDSVVRPIEHPIPVPYRVVSVNRSSVYLTRATDDSESTRIRFNRKTLKSRATLLQNPSEIICTPDTHAQSKEGVVK